MRIPGPVNVRPTRVPPKVRAKASSRTYKPTGRDNAMTRGKGKKVGLTRQASSAASKFSPAQKKTYAAVNRKNSTTIATNRARKAAMGGSSSSPRAPIQKPRNVLDQAHESFFDIGRFFRDRTR